MDAAPLLHGICRLGDDGRGGLMPTLGSGAPVETWPDCELALHVFADATTAEAFAAGVAAAGGNAATATRGTVGLAGRIVLLRREDRDAVRGSSPDERVPLVDHGGVDGLRIGVAWAWLRDLGRREGRKSRDHRVPRVETSVPSNGSAPTASLSTCRFMEGMELSASDDPSFVTARKRDWALSRGFDGTFGPVDDLSRGTGDEKADALLRRYRVRLEDGGKTFVAEFPVSGFAEAFASLAPAFDALWEVSYRRERKDAARRTRDDPRHLAVVRKMEAGWTLAKELDGASLTPPDGDVLKRRRVPAPTVSRLEEAGLIEKPAAKADRLPMTGWKWSLPSVDADVNASPRP